MKPIARLIVSVEPFLLIGALLFFWFPSNFPAQTDNATGIITAEWLWVVTGLLPIYIAYWVVKTDLWRTLPQVAKLGVGSMAVFGYIVIYIRLPFLPVPSYAIDRNDWAWLLVVFLVLVGVRWIAYGRLWSLTWVEGFYGAIILLCLVNIATAPDVTNYIIRGKDWAGLILMIRPVMGIFLIGYFIEMARRQGRLDGILQIVLVLCALIALIGLTATQWTVKSEVFTELIKALNGLPSSIPFFRRNSINPNEIGGVLAWTVPFCAVLILYPWHKDKWAWRVVTGAIFFAGAGALVLGQSRFALIGVLGALTLAFIALLPTLRLRLIAIAVIGVVGILQLGVLLNVFNDDAGEIGLSDRDERTTSQRFALWNSAIAIIQDYPLTGVGLNNFRFTPVREDYPIIGHPQLKPPHAHNEILQIGTDLGIGGMILFIGFHVALAWYLWITYRHGVRPSQIVAVAAGAGILAHGGFSIGDAIPIWDRFHFVFWILVGIGMASYHLRHAKTD